MKINFQFLVLCAFLAFPFYAQANADLIPEKIVLENTEQFGIVYTHQLKQNQTIYGLSKFFNTDMNLISAANPGVVLSDVKKMQSVNIPINTDMLISERRLSPKKHYIPVFYTVKAKDNLFRISKVYFNQKIENVMQINNLESMELSVGQKLLVGWYEYDPIYKSKLAWSEKGIEVDFASNSTRPTTTSTPTKTVKPYVPVEKKREIARQNKDNTPMKFEKVISSRNTVLETPDIVRTETTVVDNNNKTTTTTVTTTTTTPQNKPADRPVVSTETAPADAVVDGVNADETTEDLENEAPFVGELSNDPFEARNDIYKGDYEAKPVIHSKKIRAQWNSRSKDKVNLFALHATARKGSYIEVYNPMLDRMVIAKVVGNIPDKIYKNNVELIVSPKVAETLGVVDKKFFVKIRFIE